MSSSITSIGYSVEQQDGKRSLIKNQLYLIEQLQLENANLRNERDQLQLENEELKFQLQMISPRHSTLKWAAPFYTRNKTASSSIHGNGPANSHIPHANLRQTPRYSDATPSSSHYTTIAATDSSSNILSQPNGTFDGQQLEKLVETTANSASSGPSEKLTDRQSSGHHSDHLLADNPNANPLRTAIASGDNPNADCRSSATAFSNQVKSLVTPVRQPLRLNGAANGVTTANSLSSQAPSSSSSSQRRQPQVKPAAGRQSTGKCNRTAAPTSSSGAAYTRRTGIESAATGSDNKLLGAKLTPIVAISAPVAGGGGESRPASGSGANSGAEDDAAPVSRNPLQDEDEQRVKLVEQLYGDSERVQAAAIIIQRAFRKYQICKRFRTITEQLRHTCNSVSLSTSAQDTRRRDSGANVALVSIGSKSQQQQQQQQQQHSNSNSGSKFSDIQYSSSTGATRAAAWESLSQAASRLAASAAAASSAGAKLTPAYGSSTEAKSSSCCSSSSSSTSSSSSSSSSSNATSNGQQVNQLAAANRNLQASQAPAMPQLPPTTTVAAAEHRPQAQKPQQPQQDPVVAAAINFQQLESIRKRQYRVGLNIFNKNPEKGVSFLIAHSFIDSSSPYAKTSTGYYQSNQWHLIDKHLLQQHASANANIQSCQLCYEEENLKRNVAHFLLHRKGLAKEKIGQYLGNLQEQFNQDVLKYYLQELDFNGLQIDLALRKFSSTFRLPGEAQKIERIVDNFAQRYVQCQQQLQQQQQQQIQVSIQANGNSGNVGQIQQNTQANRHQIQQQPQTPQHFSSQHPVNLQSNYKNNLMLLSKDEIFILTFAIIMLNTDLHSPSLKPTSRMSAAQFVNNLRGVFKSQTINESDLIEIYERVKANQITTTPDHVTHVMKVQQGLTVTNFQKKELPNLCVPYRRLVCFCRLFEVYDVNKKERVGQHQREIFLFNDLLLVTKLARRVRTNTTQLYTYRQSISLQGLYVQLFQSANYNFGIRLCQRSNDETIIMFNARNELDQSRFVDDLSESIAEMDEMTTIKVNNIIDTIYFKHQERLQRHAMLHSVDSVMASSGQQQDNHNQHQRQIRKSDVGKNRDRKSSQTEAKSQNCGLSLSSSSSASQVAIDNQQLDNNQENGTAEQSATSRLRQQNGRRVRSKFSSMSNLSSVVELSSSRDADSDGKDDDGDSSPDRAKGLRQNHSFAVQQPLGRVAKPQSQQNSSSLSSGSQRRCSSSSVHSLDSGLFLSRDVSPNQSS